MSSRSFGATTGGVCILHTRILFNKVRPRVSSTKTRCVVTTRAWAPPISIEHITVLTQAPPHGQAWPDHTSVKKNTCPKKNHPKNHAPIVCLRPTPENHAQMHIVQDAGKTFLQARGGHGIFTLPQIRSEYTARKMARRIAILRIERGEKAAGWLASVGWLIMRLGSQDLGSPRGNGHTHTHTHVCTCIISYNMMGCSWSKGCLI